MRWRGRRERDPSDYDTPVLKLGPLEPGGLFAAADFREGDLIAAVEGAPAGSETIAAIVTGLTDGRSRLDVKVYRGGVPLDRSFRTDVR